MPGLLIFESDDVSGRVVTVIRLPNVPRSFGRHPALLSDGMDSDRLRITITRVLVRPTLSCLLVIVGHGLALALSARPLDTAGI